MAAHEYRDAYFANPKLIQPELRRVLRAARRPRAGPARAPRRRRRTIVGLVGAGEPLRARRPRQGLGAHRTRRRDLVVGRLLVFFPGEVEGNNYRLLGARTAGTTSPPSSQRERLVSCDVRPTATSSRSIPPSGDIPNLGVAKVRNPEDEGDWATLEWELRSFVCEGEYERGLERILDQFLSHLEPGRAAGGLGQRLLRQRQVPPDARPRVPLARLRAAVRGRRRATSRTLPADIEAHLAELSAAGKREGGLWSAAGTLGSGASGSVRLAFLEVVFDAAGLPQQYAPARLALWLKNEGLYDQVRDGVEAAGKTFEHELRNLYVSPVARPGADRRRRTVRRHTRRRSARRCRRSSRWSTTSATTRCSTPSRTSSGCRATTDGKLPLTLVVLDEMQQYINDDNAKAEHVQDLVEGCSSRFGSQVLVVATGQAALTANPTLAEADRSVLGHRRPVRHRRRDRRPQGRPPQEARRRRRDRGDALDKVQRRDRPAPAAARASRPRRPTRPTLVADYPLLPTRRRFWERALRAIDKAGKAGVLRTQLKIVHEAARSVADAAARHRHRRRLRVPLGVGEHAAERRPPEGDRRADPRARRRHRPMASSSHERARSCSSSRSSRTTASATRAFARQPR